jgi:predicted SnoaL-like aldol condensation-catalyzing enzyme
MIEWIEANYKLVENKLLAQKAASLWMTKEFDKLNEIYDENCTHHQQSHHHNITFTGIKPWRKYMEAFLIKYPDYQETIVSQIAEDDKVVSIIECSTSTIAWSGVTIDLIRNGKIMETWVWFKRKNDKQAEGVND